VCHAGVGPAVTGLGGLADQKAAAHPEKGSGALRDHSRRAEGAGGDDVRRGPEHRIPARLLRACVDDLHPVRQPEATARGHQVVDPAELALHQHPRPAGSGQRRWERWQSAARAQVENDAGAFTQQLGEGPGETELIVERALADPTEALGLGEDGAQGVIQGRSRPGDEDLRPRSG